MLLTISKDTDPKRPHKLYSIDKMRRMARRIERALRKLYGMIEDFEFAEEMRRAKHEGSHAAIAKEWDAIK